MSRVNNFSRQSEFFDRNNHLNQEIHIIGIGAIGSKIVSGIISHGLYKKINVWDFDTVEEHNLPNQCFLSEFHIGMKKVDAINDYAQKKMGYKLITHNKKITEKRKAKFNDIVILCVDSFKARKEIFDSCILGDLNINLFIDIRLGLQNFKVYTLNPHHGNTINKWMDSLGDDSKAPVSACGGSMTVGAIGDMVGGLVVNNIISYINKNEKGEIWNDFYTECSLDFDKTILKNYDME